MNIKMRTDERERKKEAEQNKTEQKTCTNTQ